MQEKEAAVVVVVVEKQREAEVEASRKHRVVSVVLLIVRRVIAGIAFEMAKLELNGPRNISSFAHIQRKLL